MRGSQLQIERGEQLELPLLALSLYPVCWYSLSSSSSIIARGNVTPGRGGGPLNWSAGEWAGVTRADPVDIVSTRQVMSCRQDLGGLWPPETKKARTASIRSDPCPAGAFARLHHTQIKISSPDHQPMLLRCHSTTATSTVFSSLPALPSHPVQSFCGGGDGVSKRSVRSVTEPREPGAFLWEKRLERHGRLQAGRFSTGL